MGRPELWMYKLGEAGACIETVRGVGYRMGDEA